MCVSRQKPRLEAENLLPRPRLDVLMPRLVIIASASPWSRLFCLGLASPCGYEEMLTGRPQDASVQKPPVTMKMWMQFNAMLWT